MDDGQSKATLEARATLRTLLEEDREGRLRRVLALNPSLLNGYDWPELDFLRIEICKCIVFGLPQAAMTLTNHLLETTLKCALIGAEMKRDPPTTTDPAKQLYEVYGAATEANSGLELGDAINKARRIGLISKAQHKELHRIREGLRNPYSHADRVRLLRGIPIPIAQARIVEGDHPRLEEGEPFNVEAAMVPFMHGILQKKHAEANAVPYFLALDGLIRQLVTKLFPNGGPTDV